MQINLTKELEGFIAAEVAAGSFASPSDVVQTALSSYAAELETLRRAIDEGDASPESEDIDGKEFFAQLHQKYDLETPRA